MRWVKPSRATEAPSWTYSAMASCSEGKTVIYLAPLEVEKRRLVRALPNDIKAIDGHIPFSLSSCQQCRSSVSGDNLQYRIAGIAGLVFKVQARHEVIEQPAGKYRDTDMRCLCP